MSRFTHQLHRGLEEVHIQPYIRIKSFQALIRRSGGVSIIAHQSAHHIPVLLLYVVAIVFLIGAGAGEGDVLPPAIIIKMLIDEFAAVVRVQS